MIMEFDAINFLQKEFKITVGTKVIRRKCECKCFIESQRVVENWKEIVVDWLLLCHLSETSCTATTFLPFYETFTRISANII